MHIFNLRLTERVSYAIDLFIYAYFWLCNKTNGANYIAPFVYVLVANRLVLLLWFIAHNFLLITRQKLHLSSLIGVYLRGKLYGLIIATQCIGK